MTTRSAPPRAAAVSRRGRRLLQGMAVAIATAAFLGTELLSEPYNSDEGAWMRESAECWTAARAGRFDDPVFSRENLTWGCTNPTFSKFVIGGGMSLTGFGPDTLPGRDATGAALRVGDGPLRSARGVSVILASLGVGLFHFVVSSFVTGGAAVTAAALLATSPLWVRAGRLAMTDIHGASFTLAAVAAAGACGFRAMGSGSALARIASAGVVAGLAVGSKLSAAGAVAGLGLWLVCGGCSKGGGPGQGRAACVAGRLTRLATFAGFAAAAFVATYPYLWPDPLDRLLGILHTWNEVHELRIAHPVEWARDAFRPGVRSAGAIAEVLLWPNAVVGGALLAGCAAAFALRVVRGLRADVDRRRALAWLLVAPATFLALLVPGRTAGSWIQWMGLAGGMAAAASGAWNPLAWRSSPAATALGAAFVGSLAFTVATTYVAWGRHFIPLLPALALLSAAAWHDLRGSVARRLGSGAAHGLDLSLLAGVAAILVSVPNASNERLSHLAEHGLARPAGFAYGTCGALWLGIVAAAAWQGRPGPRGSEPA